MRADSDALSERSIQNIRRSSKELLDAVMIGTQQAVDTGFLLPQTPVRDIAVQFVNIVNSAGLTTFDAQKFDQLIDVYRAFLKMTLAAYGKKAGADNASYLDEVFRAADKVTHDFSK